jgi:hypothetical protein
VKDHTSSSNQNAKNGTRKREEMAFFQCLNWSLSPSVLWSWLVVICAFNLRSSPELETSRSLSLPLCHWIVAAEAIERVCYQPMHLHPPLHLLHILQDLLQH